MFYIKVICVCVCVSSSLKFLYLLFLVSSTCFGRCFCPSSGTLDCIYSIW